MMIDAQKGRDATTADIVGAYLLANMEDYVLGKLAGTTVDSMCQVNENYTSFNSYENGKKALYMRLTKAYLGQCGQSGSWKNKDTY